MAINTIKFSQFINGGNLDNGNIIVGYAIGGNTQYTDPWTFLPSGATGDRPVPTSDIYYRLRFNTSLYLYEYYSPVSSSWVQLNQGAAIAYGTNGQVLVNGTYGSPQQGSLTFTIPSAFNIPGTFSIQGTGNMTGVSNDSTMSADSQYLIPTQAAVKAYVATVSGGFSLVQAVSVVLTTNFAGTYNNGSSGVGATITQTAPAVVVIDGVTVPLNGLVLLQNQSNPVQNGIYNLTTLGTVSIQAVFTRATYYDTTVQIIPGTLVPVQNGAVYAGTVWLQTDTVASIGTSPIQFTTFAQPSNTFVTLASNQTITGTKIFDTQVTAPSFNPSTNSGIIGTSTNDNAASGSVGEFHDAGQYTLPYYSSYNVPQNVRMLTLTAGDWDVYGSIYTSPLTGAIINNIASISLTSSTQTPISSTAYAASVAGVNSVSLFLYGRVSLPSTQNVYLVSQINSNGSNALSTCGLTARRAR